MKKNENFNEKENLKNKKNDEKNAKEPIKSDENFCIFQNINQEKMQQIVEMGTITTNGKYFIHCMTIIGQIEGHYVLPKDVKATKYEQIIPALVSIEQSKNVKGLLVVLNTIGGDIEAGLAIAELISGLSKPTVSVVLGGGHSIGVPLAVSSKFSFIVPSATMTIHPVRSSGTILGVQQSFLYFKKIQDRIVKFVVKNSKISEKNFLKFMMETNELATDIGSVIDGEIAVKIGLIDRVGSISDAIEKLYDMIEKKEKTDRKTDRKKVKTKATKSSKAIKPSVKQ